jgi:ornithine cyclodeaminase/alanine dehydrogenase-like protein (mu-crystallin family)
MRECIDAMRLTFEDFANGLAVNRPRVRYLARLSDDDSKRYWANIHAGAVPSAGVACVRAGSQIKVRNEPGSERAFRNENPRPFNWGLVILYDIRTAEPLAFIHEFELSGMRVGATTGAAVDEIARNDAAVLGMFGTGKQAKAALEAIAAVRPITRVNVFSPSTDHRNRFAADMAQQGLEIVPVSEPRTAIKGADIVSCATSAARPVFEGDWLEDGQLVVSIANSDANHKRHEVDGTTIARSTSVVINDWESVIENKQTELLDLIDNGRLERGRVFEIGDLFAGKQKVKQPPKGKGGGITYYKNNSGLAIQFAAAGAIVYRKAMAEGNCLTIPTEAFGSDLSEYIAAGFNPSP